MRAWPSAWATCVSRSPWPGFAALLEVCERSSDELIAVAEQLDSAREVVLPGTSWGHVGMYLLLLFLLSSLTAARATYTFRAYQRSL